MSLLPVHRQPGTLLPEFAELWNSFAPFSGWVPALGVHVLRVEDTVENGNYIVRVEIPGIDPAKDVTVSVRDGQLTIKAERTEKKEDKGRSEFTYGSFERVVALPNGTKEEGIDASYAQGILTVSVPMPAPPEDSARRIEVKAVDQP